MRHKFYISIADILIEVESSLSLKEMGIEKRYASFLGIPKNPFARVHLRWEESLEEPRAMGDLIFDPGSIWRLFRNGEGFYAEIRYGGEENKAVIIADKEWDNIVMKEKRGKDGWQSVFGIGGGEIILRVKMPITGGLVFHAAGIDYNGQGIMIVGHSGEGKSTMANFWKNEPNVIVMSDDRIAVRVIGDEVFCYGTPWGGSAEIASNHSVPLRAILLLEKSPEIEIHPLPPFATPMLLARAFIPWWDEHLLELSMKSIHDIIARVPLYLLRWRPKQEALNLIKSIL
ncbi:hypothetical protein H5T87_04655 [bacterium]|nr:hypothetical protein [bacterium]